MKTLVARFYDTIVAGMEDAFFVPIRNEILSEASGVCLEIGAGTGNSIGAWPTGVTKLTLTEPCSNMRVQLLSKIKAADDAGSPAYPVKPEILDVAVGGVRSLPFEDDSFDTVLVSLLLCGVDDPEASCKEIRRVLKPGGKVRYMEHVIAREGTWVRTLVPFFNIIWTSCFECSAMRDTKTQLLKVFGDVECKEVVAPFYMTGFDNHLVS